MDLTDIQNQVILVMCVLAAAKRHFTWIKGWKSLAIALAVTVAIAYGVTYWDAPLPAYLAPLRQALKVVLYAVGGHAYISSSLKKLAGAKVTPATALAAIFGETPTTGEGNEASDPGFARPEMPTKPEHKTLPPTRGEDGDPR